MTLRFQESQLGYFFFQREIRFYKTTKKTTKKFVAKLDIYHFWSLCCKL